MTWPNIVSIVVLVVIPSWVSYSIFRNNPPGRPKATAWVLAVIGGPTISTLLNLVVFALFGTNAGAGFVDVILALIVSLITASISALCVRPMLPSSATVSPTEAD